eukprot:TRINITY_DN29943_c0_g1_i4.p1 TRINITY_DN29943_c0_g1~~TRINITY_DN29943_c0_g1_i4.p1  ORF type:complete len:669 (+),score=133.65 TRINITY_DN29943_c0_g1_i4:67-2007(+)
MISSAWSIISSSAEVITGARRMTLRIHRILQPGLLELNESDRRRLLGLQKRVECLVQPLNFLLLWSKKRDSCVQQVVLSAQDLLFDVCSFVERFVPQEGSPAGVGGDGSIDSDQLEYYLRELEFACASVSMAVSIARSTEERPQMDFGCGGGIGGGAAGTSCGVGAGSTASNSGVDARGVSLSALLRASRRIQEMRGRSGDLCACPGRLYTQERSSASGPAVVRGGAGYSSGGVPRQGFVPPSPVQGVGDVQQGAHPKAGDGSWQQVLSLATFKVVATMDPRFRWRRYSISVESRLPLSQRESPRPWATMQPEVAGFHEASGGDAGVQRNVPVLNSLGPVNFPIEAALDACLLTTAHVPLPSDPARCVRELGIDSLVLVWSDGASNPGAGRDEATGCCDFPDTVIVSEAAMEGVQRPQRRPSGAVGRSLSSGLPTAVVTEVAANVGTSSAGAAPVARTEMEQTRYAFVFDGLRGTSEARSGEAEIALTPLDAMYLARLCALDDSQQPPFQQDMGCSVESASTCPPHLLTSDEVLVALLQDMDCRTQQGDSQRHVGSNGVVPSSAAAIAPGETDWPRSGDGGCGGGTSVGATVGNPSCGGAVANYSGNRDPAAQGDDPKRVNASPVATAISAAIISDRDGRNEDCLL